MITGLYAGLYGLLLVVLYLRISQRRLATRIGLGFGGDADLERRVRAHGNFIESVPMALVLLLLFEQSGANPSHVHAFGVVLLAARLAHALGISKSSGRTVGRFYGSVGTVLVVAGLSIAVLVRVVT